MKLRSVYAPKLILTAQAQFLRIMTRVVEQLSSLDLQDAATVADVFARLAAYVRGFNDEAATGDSTPRLSAVKRTEDAAGVEDDIPELLVKFDRLFLDTQGTNDTTLTLAATTLLQDFQSAPQDVFSRLAAYVRGFSEEAVPADAAPKFAAAKSIEDTTAPADADPSFTADYRRLFAETSEPDDTTLTFAATTLLQDFQSAPQDVFSRIAEYLRSFADEVAEPADALLGFAVAKLLTDTPAPGDVAPVFAVQKALTDAAQMLDQLRLSPRLGQYETLIASDARKLTTGKFFAETSKPLDLARLTPLVRFADLQDGQTDEVTLSAGLKIEESGQYVDGYGDYVDEDYFLKTPQLIETAFLFDVNKALAEGAAAADALALAFSTLLADALDAPVDNVKLAPMLGLTESQALTESQLFSIGKSLTDLAAFTETTKLAATKRLTDTQSVTDVLTRVATQYRALTDSFGTAETLFRTMAKPFADSATPADAPKKHLFLKFLEGGEYAESGYFEVDDYVVGGVAIGDSLTIV